MQDATPRASSYAFMLEVSRRAPRDRLRMRAHCDQLMSTETPSKSELGNLGAPAAATRVLYVVAEDWYFLARRLPIARARACSRLAFQARGLAAAALGGGGLRGR